MEGSDICVIKISQGKEKEGGLNLPQIWQKTKDINPHIQEAEQAQSRINLKKSMSRFLCQDIDSLKTKKE